MLTVPVFRPWRPIWDAMLGFETLRLDELATARQQGRELPPVVTPEIIRSVTSSGVQSLLHGGLELLGEAVTILHGLRPLIEAAVWPRWLMLEATLQDASSSGALHLSALALRTQIEELDALQDVARLLALVDEAAIDERLLRTAIEVLRERVLPRIRTKSAAELLEPAAVAPGATRRSERLQRAFDALGDYVHPNYGSHVLSVRPHSVQAARVLVEAFVAVYESFLSLPWAGGADGRTPTDANRDERHPFEVLAEEMAPVLARVCGNDIDSPPWANAIVSFRRQAEVTSSQDATGAWLEGGAALEEGLNLEVGAILALHERGIPPGAWPAPLSTAANRLRYALLVEDERRLMEDAARLASAPGTREDELWLPLLCSALTFSVNVTEFKLDNLGREAARLINADNVIGAALVIRSMLEHHAIVAELGRKLSNLWGRMERAAPKDEGVDAALSEAEKQVARVLAGTPASREEATVWRSLWESSLRRYHVLDPIKARDTEQPGYFKTYSLLSHIVHGTVCTGGDLLGPGGILPARRQLSQLALVLADLCALESALDRWAALSLVAHRLAMLRRDPAVGLGSRLAVSRLLTGQKLKAGRDVFGSGTEQDPFRFRRELLYHDAYYHWLKQEHVVSRARISHKFPHGIGDRVDTEDGRTLFFLKDSFDALA